jgi:MoaA/NifB/PqqE/SkfB family radical SAM enzyme
MKDELADKEVLKLIKEAAGIKPTNICICGGEPLLREKLLYKAGEILSASSIPVSMVTNGSLLTKEKIKNLIDSGISRIQVSLDGASPETHEHLRRFKGSFQSALNALSALKEVDPSIQTSVAFTPTRFNCHEIEKVFHLCRERAVNDVRSQPVMKLGRTQLNEDIIPTDDQYRRLVRKIKEIEYKYNTPTFQWGDPIDHIIRFRTVAQHCVTYVHVFANGDIPVSSYLPIVVGNVRRHSLKQYWDAGLPRVWEVPIVKQIGQRVDSMPDLGKKHEDLPIVWFDEDLRIDLIDDKLLS